MVKLIVLALSVTAATLAGNYAQKRLASTPNENADQKSPDAKSVDRALTETDLMALPVIVDGALDGFFFLRLAYTATSSSSLPADLLLSDSFYQFAVNANKAGPGGLAKMDIDEVAEGVKSAVNDAVGKPVISDIFVTQFDFFASADVRKKSIERRLVLKEEPAKKTAANDGHGAPAEAEHAAPAH
jgi:hypothetical protein